MNAIQSFLTWKNILATGAAATAVILALKTTSSDAGKALEAGANAVSNAIAGFGMLKKR